ncbi:MAG TPA: magnesium/cobalt transporter CorA [Thermoanaerobaculia bacterium]|nr:magnesium/cobalt transporter CorA [Thermoanaerobaculia bacterium]
MKYRVSILRGDELRQGGAQLIDEWSAQSGERMWVDIEDPRHEELEPLLEQRFGFHELAAEDALSANTLPKYDPFGTYDFFVFRAVDVDISRHGSQTNKLAAFLSKGFLFTVHRDPLSAVDDVATRLPSDRRMIGNGTDFLLYNIVDQMVDAHFPLLVKIEERVDDLQDSIFRNAQPHQLDELLHLKRDINVLRRHSMPQRELLNQISRGDAQFIQQEHLIYFRDVYDHMFRVSETIDVERDMMASTMEAYLSVVANRTNEIMKVLTIFSSIMLPIGVIAGIYGMNFVHMPELHWLHGYAFAIGLMGATAAVLLLWFHRKGWIRSAKARREDEGPRSTAL